MSYFERWNEKPEKESFLLKEKICDMYAYGKSVVDKWPGREKILAEQIRESMLNMVKLVIRVERKHYKKTTLEELDIELGTLEHLLVMSRDPKYYSRRDKNGNLIPPPINNHTFETWAVMLVEIGKMIGGYIKSVSEKEATAGKPQKR